MRKRHQTPEEEKRAREEAQRENEARRRQEEASRRRLLSCFKMWMACPSKACSRSRACRGDTDRCLRERWHPLTPPRLKAFLQKSIALINDGMPAREAVAAAEADIVRHEEAAAAWAREPAPNMPPRVSEHPSGPRIRSLG